MITPARTSGGAHKRTHHAPVAWMHSTASRSLLLAAEVVGDIEVKGLHHLPATGGAVLIANHRSYFDAIALAAALSRSKRDVMVLAKAELFDTGWKARALTALGTIPVHRGTAQATDALDEAVNSLAHGEVVALFPEGTIPQGGQLAPFKTGAARMAMTAGVPVIPVALVGTDQIIASNLRNIGSRLLRSALRQQPVAVTLGAPIHLTGSAQRHEDAQAMTNQLHAALTALLDEPRTAAGHRTAEPAGTHSAEPPTRSRLRALAHKMLFAILLAVPVIGKAWRRRHRHH